MNVTLSYYFQAGISLSSVVQMSDPEYLNIRIDPNHAGRDAETLKFTPSSSANFKFQGTGQVKDIL